MSARQGRVRTGGSGHLLPRSQAFKGREAGTFAKGVLAGSGVWSRPNRGVSPGVARLALPLAPPALPLAGGWVPPVPRLARSPTGGASRLGPYCIVPHPACSPPAFGLGRPPPRPPGPCRIKPGPRPTQPSNPPQGPRARPPAGRPTPRRGATPGQPRPRPVSGAFPCVSRCIERGAVGRDHRTAERPGEPPPRPGNAGPPGPRRKPHPPPRARRQSTPTQPASSPGRGSPLPRRRPSGWPFAAMPMRVPGLRGTPIPW